MGQHLAKFQDLLRELFQFDSSDLDFGIYRVMNFKRDVVETFITRDLPQIISTELARGALDKEAGLVRRLEEAKRKILAISEDAFDASGNLLKYHETKPGQEYLKVQEEARYAADQEAMEISIYNHLYTFFNRYWQDGDFISKRRYSKRERYAIPYNGEEVMLYWANRDQYYIKTGEHFTDYTWKGINGTIINFRLTAADVEQDNVQGEKRFFQPCLDGVVWDEPNNTLVLPFEYRPLTVKEIGIYGQRNQQETIITKAVKDILGHGSIRTSARILSALAEEKRRLQGGETISALEYHLRRYTRRNTSDFFIHKDLKGFLSRELDFYLKNEVLNLESLELAGANLAHGWFQTMRLVKKVGNHIIEFLAQIEEFQRMLWEKRKFVTESFYCITMGNIPEEFYPEIISCKAQWDEWRELYHIDEEETNLFTIAADDNARKSKFLKSHPTLVLDTRHFSTEFVDHLLASYDDLDETIDGLLVHSENWQALNLLSQKYGGKVRCVYIDPPYNTGQSEILYKNSYKHSSWLTLMEDRLKLGRTFLAKDGIQCTTIDDVEFHRLRKLISSIFGDQNMAGVATIKNNPSGRSTIKGFSIAHEYAIFSSNSAEAALGMLPRTKKQLMQYPEKDEIGRFQWRSFLRSGGANDFRGARPRLHYPLIVKGNNVEIPEMEWDAEEARWRLLEVPQTETVLWPVVDETEYTWRLGVETLETRFDDLRVRKSRDGRFMLEIKFRLDERGVLAKTIWDEKEMNATAYGTSVLRNIIGESQAFSFPKSIHAVERCLRVCSADQGQMVVDYFAGSGTTGHAIINLNREDGGRRKFILVEMAHYFDSVLLPRLKKVIFSPEWRDGKPRRMATADEAKNSPRIVKIIRLESYEDALNNITFDVSAGEQSLRFDDYLLQYMLHWETRKSATMLNVEKLSKPFSYQLHIHGVENQTAGVREIKNVDMPETFAYLLGLSIKKRRVLYDDDRRYLIHTGTTRDGRKTVVIWRENDNWVESDYRRDKNFIKSTTFIDGVDDVYVNGDSAIPGAQALEQVFKERMFAPVEV